MSKQMTFEEFKASGKYVDQLPECCLYNDDHPVGGMIYKGEAWIEDCNSWKNDEDPHPNDGRWYLIICRDQWRSDDLEKLERILYEWAKDEGICDKENGD